MAHSRYTFRSDYNLDKLPQTMRITQPGLQYSHKKSQDLLKYAKLAPRLPKENFFDRLQYWYDNGNVPKANIPDFGELGVDKLYPELYRDSPFENIVGAPKLANRISDEDVVERRKRLAAQKTAAEQYSHQPYRYAHQPFPQIISQPGYVSVRTPTGRVGKNFSIKAAHKKARLYDNNTDLSERPYLPQARNERYQAINDHVDLRMPLLDYGWGTV